MKKLAILVSLVLIFAVSVKTASAEDKTATGSVKIGYVDLNRTLNEVSEGKAARAKLEADGKAKKQKLEIMQNDLKKMKEDYDKQRLILSGDALRDKEGKIQEKLVELQRTSMEFEKQFSDAESTAIKPISDKIQRVIQQIGQSENYSMIVPKEMALYSPAGTDLTDKVIASYNKGK